MKAGKVLGGSVVLGALALGGCEASSFNIGDFVQRYREGNGVVEEMDRSGPAVYAFSGFGLGNMLRGSIIEPMRKKRELSDSEAIALGDWPKYIDRIVESAKNDEVFLFAHSWGCKEMVEVLNVLDSVGEEVDGLVIMDPNYLTCGIHGRPHVAGVEDSHLIPDNIRGEIIVYNSNGPFPGREFEAGDFKDSRTLERVVHRRLDQNHWDLAKLKVNSVYLDDLEGMYRNALSRRVSEED
jgi:pimeloyl-ACP methyl ester carboxylesterase